MKFWSEVEEINSLLCPTSQQDRGQWLASFVEKIAEMVMQMACSLGLTLPFGKSEQAYYSQEKKGCSSHQVIGVYACLSFQIKKTITYIISFNSAEMFFFLLCRRLNQTFL